MENASKALIIAGSILVTILVISLGVMVFNNMANSAKSATNMDKQEIAAFNSQLTPYLGENVPGSQVNSLIRQVITINITAISKDTANTVTITYPTNTARNKCCYKWRFN